MAQSQQAFVNKCSNLIARMIDTVPRSVKLTDVVEPHPSLPYHIALVYTGNGTMLFTGSVRVSSTLEF